MHRIDGPGATGLNRFTEGNPSTGTPATTVTADWLNAVQEELVELLAALGGSPDKQQNDQIATALLAALGDASEPATQAEAEAGTETALRRWSPLRVAQAIAALAPRPANVLVQTVFSVDGTIRSVTTGNAVDSGSSITITGVAVGHRLRVRATCMVGASIADTNVVLRICRDTTNITPAGLDLALQTVRQTTTALAIPVVVQDADHGGGDVTYRLYWAVSQGTGYLGRAGSPADHRGPSVVWEIEEYTP